MADYIPPLADIRFVLEHIVDLRALTGLEAFSHLDTDTIHGVVEEYGRFLADVIAPLNQVGDSVGSRRNEDGTVSVPPGFAEAYGAYVDAGWGAVPFEQEFGGGGFPWLVAIVMQELMTSSNMGFSVCPLLTQGAIDMLRHHGSPEQQAIYLEKMVTGEWTGTMNLTEPEAGSDVGALRTKALPHPSGDGSWLITGTKIFITYGEHEMAENIVHLVLARVPDAPPGTRGISCFIVPKYMVGPDGSLGDKNDVHCVSIEHKMGLHASPTCVMSYGDGDGAIGYLIGEANAGMRYMFTMMNNARLSVGVEGLALGEAAYQRAVAYARERRQGRAVGAAKGTSSPIIDHADIRRTLLTMRAHIEAMRSLLYLNAEAIDLARHHGDAAVREASQELVELLTPISKAWSTDLGCRLTSDAVQVHGGMGYIEETGVAQLFRDIRVAPIYEGTNGIQAVDLVARKLAMRGGAVVKELFARIRSLDAPLKAAGPDFATIRRNLVGALAALDLATDWLLEQAAAGGDPNDALAGATPYLEAFGIVLGGWLLARSALAARGVASSAPGSPYSKRFLDDKVSTARFYAEQVLPKVGGLIPAVTAGAAALFAVSHEV